MLQGPPRSLSLLSFVLFLFFVWTYIQLKFDSQTSFSQYKSPALSRAADPLDFSIPLQFKDGEAKPPGSNYSWVVVVPKTKEEDLRWLEDHVPEAQLLVYEVDNPRAKHKIPKNKGREAMVYLSYMIDYYEALPDTTMFIHAHDRAWHNNLLLAQESAPMIKRLNHDRVARLGYMNLRCHHEPGCPDWIHLDRPGGDFDFVHKPEEMHWRRHIWEELHPGAPIPQSLSGVCCAQFALSRDRIRQVPLERLVHYRQWLLSTDMGDEFSGRIFEYIWHYIFTGHEVYCPAQNTCYCDGYGICFGSRQNYDDYWEKSDKHGKDLDELEYYRRAMEEAEQNGNSEEWTRRLRWKAEELDEAVAKAEEWMHERRDEAFARGEDAKKRAAETENWESSRLWRFLPDSEKR